MPFKICWLKAGCKTQSTHLSRTRGRVASTPVLAHDRITSSKHSDDTCGEFCSLRKCCGFGVVQEFVHVFNAVLQLPKHPFHFNKE
jgi:hypothetical protein